VTQIHNVLLMISYFENWVALVDQIIGWVFRKFVLSVAYMIAVIDMHLSPNGGLISSRYFDGIQ